MAKLEEILRVLKLYALKLVLKDVRVFAVFGSAARGVDFIPCRSDIDVLLVLDNRHDKHRLLSGIENLLLDVKVSAAAYTPKELEHLAEAGHPLLLHLYKASIVLLDDDTLANVLAKLPKRIPLATIEIEKKATAAALALGLESLAYGEPEKTLDHVHHALRHLARASLRVGQPATLFPVYDVEVETVLEQLDSTLPTLLQDTIEARRRCKTSISEARKLLEKAWNSIIRHLDLEVPSLEKVVETCGKGNILKLETPILIEPKDDKIEIMCGTRRVKP